MIYLDCFKRSTSPITALALLTLIALPHTALAAPPSSSPPAYSGSPASPASEVYTLGAGDRLQIDVFDAPEYSGENGRYQVLVDGSLNLPLLGNLSVKGMTLKQLSEDLSRRYRRFYKRPFTTATLVAPRPLTIGVSGEVNRTGTYTLPLATQEGGTQFPTLTRALQTAGGITQSADVRQIQIRRPQRSGADQVITVDLWQYVTTGNARQDVSLRDGDSIFIPTVSAQNPAEGRVLADTTFAADKAKPVSVAIVGEVFRPGPYLVTGVNARPGVAGVPGAVSDNPTTLGSDKPPTVTQAIQIAGGIKPQADLRRIQIRRMTRSGTDQTIDVNLLELIRSGDLRQDVILQAGDTISIPVAKDLTAAEVAENARANFSPDFIRVNIVGEVRQPGTVQVPPNTPLNQALLSAGGFDQRRARKGSVELIRLNPDGSVTRRKVSIDFAQGTTDEGNPLLQNNDIVVVGRSGLASVSDTLSTIFGPITGVFNFLRIFGL
ncbi:SLBB domain-containing protein [Leptolyngbya sp. FACHB-36]|uniref:SLBB domain-containing protein n=1 Tax=Leptolyngbya sp. FACHB-36 TaxID=2692808 RepID=UPI001680E8FE|nr:SLBB domain-containing protein [Leptolyngbya sp. FACHB-36]MBD2018972.1 SLBB domain-containing protein [Leptolyngbya sp. FACHB-36]